jgi:hypothetical protein
MAVMRGSWSGEKGSFIALALEDAAGGRNSSVGSDDVLVMTVGRGQDAVLDIHGARPSG